MCTIMRTMMSVVGTAANPEAAPRLLEIAGLDVLPGRPAGGCPLALFDRGNIVAGALNRDLHLFGVGAARVEADRDAMSCEIGGDIADTRQPSDGTGHDAGAVIASHARHREPYGCTRALPLLRSTLQ
jgi:hypothetical protein